MKKSLLKTYLLVAVCLVIVFSAYYTGYKVGIEKGPSLGISVINNDLIAAGLTGSSTVDMAPFWETWKTLQSNFVGKKGQPDNQDKIWGAVKGLASAYGDPYTIFMSPVEAKSFNESINGDFEGVGMEVGIKDGIVTVIAPLKGTPAFKAGMMPGDKIITINGTSTRDMSVDDAVKLIRGKKGTEVKLSVYREGKSEAIEKIIVRDTITIPTVDTEKKGDVFVIHLYNFYAKSADLFKDALKEFVDSGSNKLVLDFRGNPGGYLDAAVNMASWFLPIGETVVTEKGNTAYGEKVHRSLGYNIFSDKLKMAILIDGGSASASEILSGALRDHGLAKLVGTKSFGKGSVQEVLNISADTTLKVTVARWYTPNNYSISESGLIPDFEVKMTEEDRLKGRDPQLDKAIDVVKNMK
ncbi:MAG: S41 family peptidase [bacterium]